MGSGAGSGMLSSSQSMSVMDKYIAPRLINKFISRVIMFLMFLFVGSAILVDRSVLTHLKKQSLLISRETKTADQKKADQKKQDQKEPLETLNQFSTQDRDEKNKSSTKIDEIESTTDNTIDTVAEDWFPEESI